MSLRQRLLLWVLALLVLPVTLIWVAVAQPSCARHARSKAVVNAEDLKRHVVALSKDFYPRSFADTANTERCVAYIGARFREAGAVVSTPCYTAYRMPCRNVAALFPGQDAQRIVIGAHYDAVASTPGADDNASGVAGLVELARLLRGVKPKHTIELVAYGSEEPPCFASEHMGSAHHVRALIAQGIPVRAMIAVEMIGRFSDESGSQSIPVPLLRLFYPAKGNFIAVVGDFKQRALIRKVKRSLNGASALPAYSICAPSFISGIDLSDHRNYWQAGMPAVMVTDTAFYRNHAYHSAEDTADRLDYRRMADAVAGLYEAVLALANE